MKQVLKNPILYYALLPVLAGLWPLLVGVMYLPAAQRDRLLDSEHYKQGQKLISEILALDPERIELVDPNSASTEFNYANALDRVANICRVPSGNYRYRTGMVVTTSGQKTQTAKVNLTDVDVTRFAKFLSTIQSLWAPLQCERIKLTRKPNTPDQWDVDLDFKYYY